MPKIKQHTLKINHNDINKAFNLQMMYSQDDKFYIVIPAELDTSFDHLSEEQYKELHLSKIYKRGYHENATYTRIVHDITEEECLDNARTALLFLMESIIVKHNVIMLWCKTNEDSRKTSWYKEPLNTNTFPVISISLEFKYAIETSAGDKKVYNVYKDNEGHRRYSIISNYEIDDAIIVDDTPNARKAIESLYDSLKISINTIDTYTSNKDRILNFIKSGKEVTALI